MDKYTQDFLASEGLSKDEIDYVLHGTNEDTKKRFAEMNKNIERVTERFMKVRQLALNGIETPSMEQKEWFLEEICRAFGITTSQIGERRSTSGIPPKDYNVD